MVSGPHFFSQELQSKFQIWLGQGHSVPRTNDSSGYPVNLPTVVNHETFHHFKAEIFWLSLCVPLLLAVSFSAPLLMQESLDNRHHLLCKQRDDAKDLKDNLDRRERVVSTLLSKHLSAAELQDYRRYVQTKASLLIRQKDLDERLRLGEEQRDALVNSLPA